MPKALVLDDSRVIRAILARALNEMGFEVIQGSNGREGLQHLAQGAGGIDLALVDWNMPEMNGLDFVRAVRSKPVNRKVRLIMVTSETEIDQMSKALQAGADEYVMKPFTREMIQEKLRLVGVMA